MGQRFDARCKNCGAVTTVSVGDGLAFHLLHCDQCGAERKVAFDEIGEPHLQYLKGLSPADRPPMTDDDHVRLANYEGGPISGKQYRRLVEGNLGPCKCGGAFRFEAKPRCPRCRSSKLKRDKYGSGTMYD